MMLSFGEAVRRYYRNYLNPEGRAQRSAFWWVVLFQVILYLVLGIVIFMAEGGDQLFEALNAILEGDLDNSFFDDFYLGSSGIFAGVLMICFGIANIIPDIMLKIRRFHDLGQSGWLVLVFMVLGAVPVFGIVADIANLIWFAFPGTNGPNKYGQDPLGVDTDIFG